MSVPRRFVGAWEREGLDVDGAAVPGIGRALWIEGGGTYVDVRAPGTVASGTSFGGRSAWRAPVFTWHHDLDLHPRPGNTDRGELTLLDDRIIERGSGIDGGTAAYEERWRRLPAATALAAIATHSTGLAVRVGDHAALVFAPPAPRAAGARAWQCADGHWTCVISLGPARDLPAPDGAGWSLTRGWSAARATR
jgi:allophanate hydrolase